MNSNYIRRATVLVMLAASLAAPMLAGCDRAPSPPENPPAPAAPATPPPSGEAPVPAPSGEVPPADAAEPAPSPAPDAPPPTEPSPVPKPTAMAMASADEPSLESMRSAIPSAKISVPVELRYRLDGEALPDQPVTLHLAAVPRVPGTRLQVSVKAVEGLRVASGPLEVQKANSNAAYRQQLSVTRSPTGPEQLRVLVTMDMAEGNGFGYFTIPLASGITAQKLDSVKQR